SQPCAAREGAHDARPGLRRAAHRRLRGRLRRGGVPRARRLVQGPRRHHRRVPGGDPRPLDRGAAALPGAPRRLRRHPLRAEATPAPAPADRDRRPRRAGAPARGALRRRLVRLRAHGGGGRPHGAGAPPAARDDGPPAARDLAYHLRAADAGARHPGHPGGRRPPDRHAARPRGAARGDGARARRGVRALIALEQVLDSLSNFVWGWPLLVLLVGTHVYLTIRLRVIQRYLGTAIRLSFSRTAEGEGDVSHFGALTTALAATIGTGNIVGVATAVAAGGPGAVLWMWLTGIFGIATKYGDAVLAIKYRIKTPKGAMAGGPMYVLERGLHMRWLGVVFATLTAIAAFGIGNMVQANSISAMVVETFGVRPWITGIVMTACTAVVILGGIKSIANVCEKLVPFMAVFYIVGCTILLVMHAA